MKFVAWALLWLPMLLVGLVACILSPFACLFVTRGPYTDTVKRLGRIEVTLQRDRLVKWLSWFDTFDNATDEYWYGMYGFTVDKTQVQYDGSRWLRYLCRVLWLQRNSAYGFNYSVVSIAPDSPLAFQFQKDMTLPFGYYNSVNIGWKSHKGFAKLMYAGRIIGIRKK